MQKQGKQQTAHNLSGLVGPTQHSEAMLALVAGSWASILSVGRAELYRSMCSTFACRWQPVTVAIGEQPVAVCGALQPQLQEEWSLHYPSMSFQATLRQGLLCLLLPKTKAGGQGMVWWPSRHCRQVQRGISWIPGG